MCSDRLSRIELFAFDTRPSFADKPVAAGSSYLVLKLTCGEQVCYGEGMVSMKGKALDLIKWGAYLLSIQHATLEEVLMTVRLHGQEWTTSQLELLESASIHLNQASYPRFKMAAESGRHRNQGNIAPPPTPTVSCPVHWRTEKLSISRLIDESVSYYSIFSKI